MKKKGFIARQHDAHLRLEIEKAGAAELAARRKQRAAGAAEAEAAKADQARLAAEAELAAALKSSMSRFLQDQSADRPIFGIRSAIEAIRDDIAVLRAAVAAQSPVDPPTSTKKAAAR